MPIAQIKFNIRYHFSEMIRNWSGKEATLRKIIETIDSQGNIIDRTATETTIYAIIGNPPFDEKLQPPGAMQSGTLCLYYWYADDLDSDIIVSVQLTPMTERHDQIDFQGNTYAVTNIDEIAYDLNSAGMDHEPIFAKYTLRKVTPS